MLSHLCAIKNLYGAAPACPQHYALPNGQWHATKGDPACSRACVAFRASKRTPNTFIWVCAGVEVRDVDVAKGILTAILEGHVEGLADTEDMEYGDDADEDQGGQNRRRCTSLISISCLFYPGLL
jgi:hypothetical protein